MCHKIDSPIYAIVIYSYRATSGVISLDTTTKHIVEYKSICYKPTQKIPPQEDTYLWG
jgi:hypothetical protein